MNINEIVNWAIGQDKISVKEVLSYPKNFLKIQIIDNQIKILSCEILENGNVEERQFSIIKMLKRVCNKFKIPNLTLTYCTHDKCEYNGPIFTHARLKNQLNGNILAPCFTFDSYPEGPDSILTDFGVTYKNLISNESIEWENKKNSLIFVGHVGDNNNRLNNTNIKIKDEITLEIKNQQSTSNKFISREFLSNYKFLLHLNGNNGAYASRFKYLLGNKSLVFYNFNSGNNTNFWEEWWMYDKFFIPGEHYVDCSDKHQLEEKINYYFENQNKAKQIAENGYNFFKNYLNTEFVDEFWKILLTEYSKKLID